MRLYLPALLCCLAAAPSRIQADPFAVELPPGIKAVWDLSRADRTTTATRERICLNGLWRWLPAAVSAAAEVPTGRWGYFKVPGCWPGVTDYMQKDCQKVWTHPSWQAQALGGITAAWHQREIQIPAEWKGRQLTLQLEYLNSYAVVYIDSRRLGEIRFPGGELDVTAVCTPGASHVLTVWVEAMPLKALSLSYTDTAAAREIKGSVPRRGLCGDVFLVSRPAGPQINDVQVQTSVRKKELTCRTILENLDPHGQYTLKVRVQAPGEPVQEFTSQLFQTSDAPGGRFALTEPWLPKALWDTSTPQNTCLAEVALADAAGQILDAHWPLRFGFREFWIDGRDFVLNGSRIFLSALPLDNAQISAALASYGAARESLERLQSFGINFVYTHNYGCEPGSHLSFEEILRAADDVGMLVGFSQPHFSQYDWQVPGADATNGYARHAQFYVRAAQNHPSVVMYAMSHNATGYSEDMNPDMIDGVQDPRDTWAARNAKLAVRAERIVQKLDPSRIVYHHASGNLGAMHTSNFYPNFAPIQELSDWFEHWSQQGIKPAFTCEYGAPFTWDWTLYRGWYEGQREFGSAKVPWEFCLAEWNAQFLGDQAFQISDAERANLRWEASQLRAGKLWHRWDYPNQVGSSRFTERYPIFAAYLTDNWRAFRTWGVSAISPWEHEHFWTLRAGVDKAPKSFQTDWENLQRPGFSPDFEEQRYERMDLAFGRSDWVATPAAEALLRNNRPLLAYLAGKPARFTSKDHIFLPGETVDKQFIVINNSRQTVSCECQWSLAFPTPIVGSRDVTVAAGQQERIPLRLTLPSALNPGIYQLNATASFNNGEVQKDTFTINVLSPAPPPRHTARIALFDPKGETSAMLKRIGIRADPVDAGSDLSGFDLLIVGKSALTLDGAAPDIRRVRQGLKVVLFEQTSTVLEQRFGFRVQEYGLRQVFARVPDHPALAGITTDELRDWRGEATILLPRLKYEMRPRYGPTVQWCGIPVTRAWRCGNQGNIASVLIEKPARGDFLPIVDGGFSLQFSPLMEVREGAGMMIFCQLDVTGRTELEPVADRVVQNLIEYVSVWVPSPRREVIYVGEPGGKKHLDAMGLASRAYGQEALSTNDVLIVGPGAGEILAQNATSLRQWFNGGGYLFAVGLNEEELQPWLPFHITTSNAEHVAAFFPPFSLDSSLRGVGPADVHNRDPRQLPLITGGARRTGNGILASSEQGRAVFCQLTPWSFEPLEQMNLRRTHRRASFLVSRLLANMGVASPTPVLERFHQPVDPAHPEQRWLDGLYLDQPKEWDDPYRFFRW